MQFDIRQFTMGADGAVLVSEASDLSIGAMPRQIDIRGARSMQSFVYESTTRDAGGEDVIAWIYRPLNSSLGALRVHILND